MEKFCAFDNKAKKLALSNGMLEEEENLLFTKGMSWYG